ncbi:MAG: phospholipase D-like domain-containing protein [Candidatus Lokiarchaeia archaeon]
MILKFINNKDELYKTILRIIRESKKYLYIVSPYMSFEKGSSSINALRFAIIDAMKRHINIIIITRGNDPQAPKDNIYKIRDFLSYSKHIYLVPYLHSKIYCNESQALITSLNLSISSLFNQNEESGVLLKINRYPESGEYNNVISYLDSLKNKAF